MSGYTHHTAPTQFVETNGIRFAYRRFGNNNGVPLVFNQHLMGNLDSWDPAVTDGLAREREVILFNNAGVASSTGVVPRTFSEMATNAGHFIDALELSQVDVLGFSIGSMVAQMIALQRPQLVCRLILVGSGPRNGENVLLTPESQEIFSKKYINPDDFWLEDFFSPSAESMAAGRAFLKRRDARTKDRDVENTQKVAEAQLAASAEWGNHKGERFAYLRQIKQPTLVVNGKTDLIVYTINSFHLYQSLPNAQLILYPDAAHGSIYQYPELFVTHASEFLRM